MVEASVSIEHTLQSRIMDEMSTLLGFPKRGLGRKLIAPALARAAKRFAEVASGFEQHVSEAGFSFAAEWILRDFTSEVRAHNHEGMPASGPLLIAANHPGGIDGLAIAASCARDDLKIVVSQIPFIRLLPTTSRHMIWSAHDPHERMLVVHKIIRVLQAGSAVLIFPSGTVDPYPDRMIGADTSLDRS